MSKKCKPFHTNSKEYEPQNRSVYHDDPDCYEGKKIKKRHRRRGKAKRPRCKVCD